MKYTVASVINLAILLIGIIIGVLIAPHIIKTASAGSAQQTPNPPNSAQIVARDGQKITPVQPTMTAGTIGIYLILAHHIQSDQLVVNGYDLLKLQNAELTLLSRFVPASEIAKAVNDARVPEVYQVQNPTPAPVPAPTPAK